MSLIHFSLSHVFFLLYNNGNITDRDEDYYCIQCRPNHNFILTWKYGKVGFICASFSKFKDPIDSSRDFQRNLMVQIKMNVFFINNIFEKTPEKRTSVN